MSIIEKTLQKIKEYKAFTAVCATMVAVIVGILLIAVGHSTKAVAENDQIQKIAAPATTSVAAEIMVIAERSNEHFAVPIQANDNIPVSIERGAPLVTAGISKNSEVTLTADQADYVQKFGQYLAAKGQWAVVTSGERSPENQLSLIKDRIAEHNASAKFPALANATLADTKIWMAAWQWLRSKHVPVNAPENIPGAQVSNHLKGMAIDFIGGSLDNVNSWLRSFSTSKMGKSTALYITSIAREPGCVHINLARRSA